jgi:WD40 repeat protein
VGATDGAYLWDVRGPLPACPLLKVREPGGVVSVAFDPKGQWFATGHEDGAIRVYAAGSRQVVASCRHAGRVNGLGFTRDGTMLVSASADHAVGLWEPSTGTLRATLRHHRREMSAVAVSPDGRLILTASFGLSAQLWARALGKRVAPPFEPALAPDYLWAVFSPDGQTVATAGSDRGRVCLWPMPTPYRGESRHAVRAMEVLTGLESLSVGVRPLAADGWHQRRLR